MSRTESPRLSPLLVIAQATFRGCVAVVRLVGSALRDVLPSSVHLPEPDASSVACLLLFGEQQNATTCFAGVPMPWGVRYHELMVAVPFVRWNGGTHPHLFVHRMLCDYWPAVWVGNSYYGFNKSLARVTWDGRRFSANDESNPRLFCADLLTHQPAPRQALAWIESAARLPVLGRRADSTFVPSRFEWDFEPAIIRRTKLRLLLCQGSLGLLLENRSDEDAYWVEGMRWRLSWPSAVPVDARGTDVL
jgi:hypothetical protein